MRDDVIEVLRSIVERRLEWGASRSWVKEHEPYLREHLSPGSLLRLKVESFREAEAILTRLGVPFTPWVPPPDYYEPGPKRPDLVAASKAFRHCSTREDVIEVLKSLVEGRLEGITWRPWRKEHEALLRQLFSPGSCLRLKHYPVTEAASRLAKAGVPFVASDELKWLESGPRSGRCEYCGAMRGDGRCPRGCLHLIVIGGPTRMIK